MSERSSLFQFLRRAALTPLFWLDDAHHWIVGTFGLAPDGERYGWWRPVHRARFEDSQRRLEAFQDALEHERTLSDRLAAENRRLRLALRLPGPNPPEGYFDV